jgi:F-type H+-transporting ATPase subunit gamma
MKMVSTVKLQKFTRLKHSTGAFLHHITMITSDFNYALQSVNLDILTNKKTASKADILFFTSDRGLCGRYNSNLFREVLKLSESLKKSSIVSVFSCIGQKGHAYLQRLGMPVEHFYTNAASHPDLTSALAIAEDCVKRFTSGATDEVYMIHTQKKSSLQEEPVVQKILPLEHKVEKVDHPSPSRGSFILESSAQTTMRQVLEMKTFASVYCALIEAAESEHAARMSTMDTASTNCDRMIQHYQQLKNRARQTAITTELSEIVTGKEALEG